MFHIERVQQQESNQNQQQEKIDQKLLFECCTKFRRGDGVNCT